MADITVARNEVAAVAAVVASARNWHWALAGFAMVLTLIAPALWNGFPLIFPDTGGYLERPFDGTLAMGRSALYGAFLYLGVPFAFWPVVLAQAAVTAWIVVLILRALSLGGRPWLAALTVLLLSIGTSLPWFTAQLMPDILFPAAVLALYLLAFRLGTLSAAERLGLVAVIAVAIASHMAALGLCVGLIGALWLLSLVTRLPRPRLRYTAAASGAGVLLCLLSNFLVAGSFSFTPGGASFLFGRLIEDGIVARYLGERCPDPALRICGYYRDIPTNADDWLWGSDSPFYKLGGAEGFGPEAQRIVADSIARYPLMHLKAATAATIGQLLNFETEVSTVDNHPTLGTIENYVPQLLAPVKAARQQAAPFDVAPLNRLHVPVAVLGVIGIAGALALRRRLALSPEAAALCLTVLLALSVNAAICGVFSHPVDRYQSRLAPLAPLALALVLMARREHPRLDGRGA